MIFGNSHEQEVDCDDVVLIEEDRRALRVQDLQEEKDKLLVETSDMLHLSIFKAEILLKNHSWSKEQLLQSWFEDPVKCCESCGVSPPEDVQLKSQLDTNNSNERKNSTECGICLCEFNSDEKRKETPVEVSCSHKFCRECWREYLTRKIDDGSVTQIFCPANECFTIIEHEIVESLVSREMARKYLHFDIKAFVDSNPTMKWCPAPGCGLAVRNPYLNDSDNLLQTTMHSTSTPYNQELSKSIECDCGHYFCWDCLQEGHEPTTCINWKEWFEKIQKLKPEDLSNANQNEEQSANYLWLMSNSKKCPNSNCNAPIQKNEGCNHMKCSKCKHDFCWVCMEPWKKHSSLTGGYFQCNRYEVLNKVSKKEKDQLTEAEDSHSKVVELNRFVHYYTRFRNHEQSYIIEKPLLESTKSKFETIINAIMQTDTEVDARFIEDAIRELLRARRILRSSYVFGFYLDSTRTYKKFIFEFIQTEFEESTEILSQMIARPYLKTPRSKIIRATNELRRKRAEFLDTIAKGLIMPLTPPNLKRYSKQRWKYLLKDETQNDDEMKNAIALSLRELNPRNPWIVDNNGRHRNLMSLIEESPQLESDLESILIPSKNQGVCAKWDCQKAKAINALSGALCNYCSIGCAKSDAVRNRFGVSVSMDEESEPEESEGILDTDLRMAVEMSRAQRMHNGVAPVGGCRREDLAGYQDEMQVAIELSLKSYNESEAVRRVEAAQDEAKVPRRSIESKKMPFDGMFLASDYSLSLLLRNVKEIVASENVGPNGCSSDEKLSKKMPICFSLSENNESNNVFDKGIVKSDNKDNVRNALNDGSKMRPKSSNVDNGDGDDIVKI